MKTGKLQSQVPISGIVDDKDVITLEYYESNISGIVGVLPSGIATTDENVDWIDFNPQTLGDAAYQEGRIFYDEDENTFQFYNDVPNFLNYVNQASSVRLINNTGETISAGTVVDIHGIDGISLEMHVADAANDANKSDEGWVLAVTAEEVVDGAIGLCAFNGTILNVNTEHLTPGAPAYLNTDGLITNNRPSYPAESVLIGAAIVAHASEGVLAVKVSNDNYDYEFDGTVLERQNTNIVVHGGIVYMDVSNLADSTRDLPIQIDGTIYQLDTTTGGGDNGAARIALTDGTATVPTTQVVYVTIVGGVATLDTTGETPDVPYASIAIVSLLDAATTASDGALMNRRTTTAKAHNGRGRIAYLNERLLIESPKWVGDGITPSGSVSDNNPDRLDFSVASGTVYQVHKQDFPEISVIDDGIYLANGSGGTNGLTNFTKYFNLADLCGYVASDVVRDTKCRGNLIIFGLINKETSECKLMVNLPTTLYSDNDAQAYYDYNVSAVTSVSTDLRHTAFLIARIPYELDGLNSLTFINPVGLDEIINMLGVDVNTTGGSAGGSASFIPDLSQVLNAGASADDGAIEDVGSITSAKLTITSDAAIDIIASGNLTLSASGVVRTTELDGSEESTAVVNKGYFDDSVDNNSHVITYSKSGTISGNIVIPYADLSLTNGFYMNANGTSMSIDRVEVVLGSSSSSQATNIDVSIRSYPTTNGSQYSVGNGTLVFSKTLFQTASAATSSYYRAETADVSTITAIDDAVLFCDINTKFYTCQDIIINVFYSKVV